MTMNHPLGVRLLGSIEWVLNKAVEEGRLPASLDVAGLIDLLANAQPQPPAAEDKAGG